jgi:CheY-like chemotaxis protein
MDAFKVLVADDSAIYRKLVEQTLSEDSCSVLYAHSGQEAIATFEREQPSLVITDWEMPDFTGIELCQRIRASSGSSRYTYVILLTSNAEKQNVVKGLSAGADSGMGDQEWKRKALTT